MVHNFFHCVPSKKPNFFHLFFSGRTDANQQKDTKNSKSTFYKKLCQYDDSCNNNYYFSDNKDKNINFNNNNHKYDNHNNDNSNINNDNDITKNKNKDYNNTNNNNDNNENNNASFNISKLIRSSHKYCFLIVNSAKKMLFNSVVIRTGVLSKVA